MAFFMYRQLQSCHHRHCHLQPGRPWSLCRSEPCHWPWSSAGTAYRKSTGMLFTLPHYPGSMNYYDSHFSSSSSMKPLLSWSMMAKAFLMSSEDLADRPTLAKKALWLKESAAACGERFVCPHEKENVSLFHLIKML